MSEHSHKMRYRGPTWPESQRRRRWGEKANSTYTGESIFDLQAIISNCTYQTINSEERKITACYEKVAAGT